MIKALDVMKAVQKVIKDRYPRYEVKLDFPDLDRQKTKTTIYIQTDNGELGNLTTSSDQCTMNLTVYIATKGDSSDVMSERVWDCFESIYALLRGNPSLDGVVADSMVTGFDYYPSIMDNVSSQAVTFSLSVVYEKDFID